MKTEARKRKLNNRGMTLVEVIIAAVILMLVITPTLRLFASSASFNGKARKNMRAITAAESVMESFKAYDMKALVTQFNTSSFKGLDSITGETAWSVTGRNAAGNPVADLLLPNGDINPEVEEYEFIIRNGLEEGNKYDVRIKVRKNIEESVVKTNAMNQFTDAVIQIPESYLNGVLAEVETEIEAYVLTLATNPNIVAGTVEVKDWKITQLDRTVTVNMAGASPDTVGVSIQYAVVCEVDYGYLLAGTGDVTAPTATYNTTVNVDFDESDPAPNDVLVVFNSTNTGAALQNVFLYYYPTYSDAGVTLTGSLTGIETSTDTISFSNSTGREIAVHVAKQKSAAYSNAVLQIKENNSSLTVTGSGDTMTLQHNELTTNLGDTSPTPTPMTNVSYAGSFSDSDSRKTFAEGIKDDKRLLYDVSVFVYEPDGSITTETDGSKAVSSFISTMND